MLKSECLYREKPETLDDAHWLVDEFIDYYNYDRIRTKFWMTPFEIRCDSAAWRIETCVGIRQAGFIPILSVPARGESKYTTGTDSDAKSKRRFGRGSSLSKAPRLDMTDHTENSEHGPIDHIDIGLAEYVH